LAKGSAPVKFGKNRKRNKGDGLWAYQNENQVGTFSESVGKGYRVRVKFGENRKRNKGVELWTGQNLKSGTFSKSVG